MLHACVGGPADTQPVSRCALRRVQLGENTSVDEAGTAAYKTVELDDILGGAAQQSREVMAHESPEFRRLFPRITYLRGGVDSGFHHVEPSQVRLRLLQIKGVEQIVVREVPARFDSLNSGDVFILDAPEHIYQLNGKDSRKEERHNAAAIAAAMRDEDSRRGSVIVLEEAALDTDADGRAFCALLGGSGALKPAEAGGADADVKPCKKLFRLTDGRPPEEPAPLRRPASAASAASAAPPTPAGVAGDASGGYEPEADVDQLHKALHKFIGKDTDVIVTILGTRNAEQRHKIRMKYQAKYQSVLYDIIRSNTLFEPQFRRLCHVLLLQPAEYDAFFIERALDGVGTDESMLTEILCTASNDEIAALRDEWQRVHGAPLENSFGDKLGLSMHGDYVELLKALLKGAREPDSASVDVARAKADAQALFQAGESRWLFSDHKTFLRIFTQSSYMHLRAVFDEYALIGKRHSIEMAIERCSSGHFRRALELIVAIAQHRLVDYYADRLYKSMKGLGTDNDALVRVILTQREKGLDDIKHAFHLRYGGTLTSWVEDDTGGAYSRLLLRLVGPERDVVHPMQAAQESMQFTQVADGVVKRSELDSNDVFIFDAGFHIFVWVGRKSSARERKSALQYAQVRMRPPRRVPRPRLRPGRGQPPVPSAHGHGAVLHQQGRSASLDPGDASHRGRRKRSVHVAPRLAATARHSGGGRSCAARTEYTDAVARPVAGSPCRALRASLMCALSAPAQGHGQQAFCAR